MNIDFNFPEEKIKERVIKNFSHRDFAGEEYSPSLDGEARRIAINKKIFDLILILLFFFIFLNIIQLFNLQIVKGNYYLKVARENSVRIEPIKAGRGIIYDRQLRPLVRNIPKFSLFWVPTKISQQRKEEMIEKLAGILNQEKEELSFLLQKTTSHQPVLVKESLNYEAALLFEIEKENFPGLILQIEQGRQYLMGPEFSHLLGYTGKISPVELEREIGYSYTDEIGKDGIEKYYEKKLRGRDGRKRVETDLKGREVVVAQEPAKNGEDVILTIDLDWQKKLAEILARQIKSAGANRGAAIILNPKNGEILALISYPYFDNNLFSQGLSKKEFEKIRQDPNQPLFFRSIAGEYMSGSTIKPVLALGALEEGIIDEQTTIISTGALQVGNQFYSDWKKGGHGPTQVKKALAESVNTFFYLIGGGDKKFLGLGPEKMNFYLNQFGLGKKTNIDLPGERDGFLPSPAWKKTAKNEDWYIGDSYNLSIGHGEIRTTPLQIAYLTGLIANEGQLFQPHLLKENSLNQEFSTLPFKKENFKIVKEGMREAVIYGTAKALNNLSIKVAGKTGTVETNDGRPHSWFTCFFPYDDPRVVMTVLIENGGEGSGPALRTVKEFLEWYIKNENSRSKF
ncbi:MAG: penicillin-binding protein 2 [Patescibacteria group bacterium]|nr:penicillin-binding protein 2 [Patescibacteria group bacterium]